VGLLLHRDPICRPSPLTRLASPLIARLLRAISEARETRSGAGERTAVVAAGRRSLTRAARDLSRKRAR